MDVPELPIEEDVVTEATLDITVEPETDFEDLAAELVEETEELEDLTEDLADEFMETFPEDLAAEADDVDLTEDLSEELGTEKFFRETEPGLDDEEDDDIPRSW